MLYPNKNVQIILKNDHLWSFFNIIYTFLGSIFEPCYIQNRVITNLVINRLKCTSGINDDDDLVLTSLSIVFQLQLHVTLYIEIMEG